MEDTEFSQQLQESISRKAEWYNTEELEKLLLQYRLIHSCVRNLYDMLTKRSLIESDPYRLDKHISDISLPDTSPFNDSDIHSEIGKRFSEYETMLDYICTYVRFAVDSLPIPKVKKLLDFCKVFEWEDVVISSSNPNAHGLAVTLNNARNGAPAVVQSMVNDSINKCAQASAEIKKILNELGIFQREIYKYEIRREIIMAPHFDSNAKQSQDAEFNEIKKHFPKVFPKRPFYSDLVNEICSEDIGPSKENNQEAVLKRLEIKAAGVQVKKKKTGPNTKELLMATVLSIGALAPTINQLHVKLNVNFDVLFEKKKTFFNILFSALKKAFHIAEKEKIIILPIKDAKTGGEKSQKLNVTDFMTDLSRKERIYSAIGSKGAEYQKIESSSEDAILSFVNKQISEAQSAFTIINALDAYFKDSVDTIQKAKIKGMQIELSALRNTIISVNKKRGDYISYKEEAEQMKKLGINENEG
ncbi:MAG: hypothetical protein K5681_04575 [Treponema sp.]|nr:hypothetical protein [Treponema sp.]